MKNTKFSQTPNLSDSQICGKIKCSWKLGVTQYDNFALHTFIKIQKYETLCQNFTRILLLYTCINNYFFKGNKNVYKISHYSSRVISSMSRPDLSLFCGAGIFPTHVLMVHQDLFSFLVFPQFLVIPILSTGYHLIPFCQLTFRI